MPNPEVSNQVPVCFRNAIVGRSLRCHVAGLNDISGEADSTKIASALEVDIGGSGGVGNLIRAWWGPEQEEDFVPTMNAARRTKP